MPAPRRRRPLWNFGSWKPPTCIPRRSATTTTRTSPPVEFGLARTATLIQHARAESATRCCSTTATSCRATRWATTWRTRRGCEAGAVHPVIAAMNTLGYDAGNLGNHEFNYGLDFLQTCARRRQLPVRQRQRRTATTGATPAEDATLSALPDPRPDGHRRRRRRAADPHRPDRLRAAADHRVGPRPPRGPRHHPRHRRGRRGLGAAGCAPRARQLVIALCHSGIGAAQHTARRWRTPPSRSPPSRAST